MYLCVGATFCPLEDGYCNKRVELASRRVSDLGMAFSDSLQSSYCLRRPQAFFIKKADWVTSTIHATIGP